ncbi:MAG: PHP domain-containing protein, partial [Bifidobacteriaceae bacterium]|nr:PHP domain-containing protein [Bifidobacteriaceae bacterium]
MKKNNFAHLHCHSAYSLKDSPIRIPNLVDKVRNFGQPAVALTDHGNVMGAYELYEYCMEHTENSVKPIIGIDTYLVPVGKSRYDEDNTILERFDLSHNDIPSWEFDTHLTIWAENNQGLKNLFDLSTRAYAEGLVRHHPRIDLELLNELHMGLIGSTGSASGDVQTQLALGHFEQALDRAQQLQDIFGKDHFYVELLAHNLESTPKVVEGLVKIARQINAPLLATNDVHYLEQVDIESYAPYLQAEADKGTNGFIPSRTRATKPIEFVRRGSYLKSTQEMLEIFQEFPEAIESTLEVVEKCNISFDAQPKLFTRFKTPAGQSPETYLREKVEAGLIKLYGGNQLIKAQELAEQELDIIEKYNLASNFLIVADLLEWYKSQDLFAGMQLGSVSASLVNYALGVLEIDPLQFDLYSEDYQVTPKLLLRPIRIWYETGPNGFPWKYLSNIYGKERVMLPGKHARISGRDALRIAREIFQVDESQMKEWFGEIWENSVPGVHTGTVQELIKTRERELFLQGKYVKPISGSPNETKAKVGNLARLLTGLSSGTYLDVSHIILSDNPVHESYPLISFERRSSDSLPLESIQFDLATLKKLGANATVFSVAPDSKFSLFSKLTQAI